MSLITKYRPTNWDEFIGNEEIVRSVRDALDNDTSHAFLFGGGSGFGKTTLARIAARHLGTSESNIIEIDGATYTGIDNMREVAEGLRYRPLGRGTNKVVIVDEAHALSRQASQSILKIVEEPPSWVHWFFCTTNPDRVLATIRTRCAVSTLKPLDIGQLRGLLNRVVKAEELRVPATIVDLCAREAYGSARRALANLAQTIGFETREEAARAIGRVVDGEDVEPIALARVLLRDEVLWTDVIGILDKLKDDNPESIRHVVRQSVITAIFNAGNDTKRVCELMRLLDEFLVPMEASNGIGPIMSACARWCFR